MLHKKNVFFCKMSNSFRIEIFYVYLKKTCLKMQGDKIYFRLKKLINNMDVWNYMKIPKKSENLATEFVEKFPQ